jgi:hypothetical protein
MYEANGHGLCLDHYSMLIKTNESMQRQEAALLNHLVESMEVTSGLPRGTLGRHPIPQPTVLAGPTTVNRVSVDRSTVGAINMGSIERLKVSLRDIQNGGDVDVAEALRSLTAAVVKSQSLPKEAKSDAVDQVSYLAGQAALPPDQRERGVARTVFNALRETLSVVADIASVWSAVAPLLARVVS